MKAVLQRYCICTTAAYTVRQEIYCTSENFDFVTDWDLNNFISKSKKGLRLGLRVHIVPAKLKPLSIIVSLQLLLF